MKKSLSHFTFWGIVLLCAHMHAQLLQNFANAALFNLNDQTCAQVAGLWKGEETEWLNNGQEKGKYQINFNLQQQGNKVSGTSYISFDDGRSYGKFNIRGMVLGNKLYFEEYEIQEQNFTQANVLWCLRTGELTISNESNTLKLEGKNYKGYAATYFFECQSKVGMSLSKQVESDKEVKQAITSEPSNINKNATLHLYPNPADKLVNIEFNLAKEEDLRIDLFSLSGEFITNILQNKFEAGTHQSQFNTANLIAGVYVVRLHSTDMNLAALLVISR